MSQASETARTFLLSHTMDPAHAQWIHGLLSLSLLCKTLSLSKVILFIIMRQTQDPWHFGGFVLPIGWMKWPPMLHLLQNWKLIHPFQWRRKNAAFENLPPQPTYKSTTGLIEKQNSEAYDKVAKKWYECAKTFSTQKQIALDSHRYKILWWW